MRLCTRVSDRHRRSRPNVQLAESAVVGAAAGTLLLIFVVLYEPGWPAGLSDYWKGYYLPIDQG